MLILGIRTDKPEAELYLYEDNQVIASETWEAHRKLGETIHLQIKDLLDANSKTLSGLEGLVIYQGPGSFTGLRIGISVFNALADSLDLPICGAEGEDWLEVSIKEILTGNNHKIVLPEYGAPVHITKQKK